MQEVEIRDVWAHNLEEELSYIRKLVIDYPVVAMVRFRDLHLIVKNGAYGLSSKSARSLIVEARLTKKCFRTLSFQV